MTIPTAFRIALETWSSWVDREINKNRTRIFFRTFEPSHWRYFYFTANMILYLSMFIFEISLAGHALCITQIFSG